MKLCFDTLDISSYNLKLYHRSYKFSSWGLYKHIPPVCILKNEQETIINKRESIKLAKLTAWPSGKQRQKKSGRGRPTASFTPSVIIADSNTE